MAQIVLSGIGKSYRGADGRPRPVLAGVDFSIAPGEVVGLMGASGCGKSTLLNIVAGLDQAHSGSVLIQGRPMAEQLKAGFRVAYVFQEARLAPWMTLSQNIAFALQAARFDKAQWPERIRAVLAMVGLEACAGDYPGQLSGGMQQRAAIARAFSIEPDILLMDEPFSALDELTARQLRQSLHDIWSRLRTTILFVSHNAFESTYLADRILVIGKGRSGEPDAPAAGHVAAEIDLRAHARPRSYDDTALFERSKQVIAVLERHAPPAPMPARPGKPGGPLPAALASSVLSHPL